MLVNTHWSCGCENRLDGKNIYCKEVIMMDTFRKEYTPLDDNQKMYMQKIKELAENLLFAMNEAVPQDERSERSRCMAVARTNLEQAVMWAVKGVTAAQA
jgi:hypothetical protein